jgi:hypothetical protein
MNRIVGKYHPIKEANIYQGDDAEARLINTFRSYFCKDLVKDKNKWAIMDYYCDCCMVELKSRNDKKDKYETTMVGLNKIKYALKKPNKASYFVFEFTDGLYYWELNKDELDTFEIRLGGTMKRGEIEEKDYVYIPIEKLVKLELSSTNPPCCSSLVCEEPQAVLCC